MSTHLVRAMKSVSPMQFFEVFLFTGFSLIQEIREYFPEILETTLVVGIDYMNLLNYIW